MEVENTVEYIDCYKRIEEQYIVNGKLNDGKYFLYMPPEEILVFDTGVTSLEWDKYLLYKELRGTTEDFKADIFETTHLVEKVKKGTELWKQILYKFKETFPDEIL